MTKSEKLKKVYLGVAVTWLNACAFFVVVCIALEAGFFIRERVRMRTDPGAGSWNPRAMHSRSGRDSQEVFRECELLTSVSRPWIGFSEPPTHSRWVNIDPADPVPIRRTPAPVTQSFVDEKMIWIFGGSTGFGYGLPDDLTLSAQLQDELQRAFPASRIRVINHAHLGHFSYQEAALFQWLLRSGQHANLAVFLDGVNDALLPPDEPFFDEARFSQSTPPLVTFSPQFPVVRLVNGIRKRTTRERPDSDVLKADRLRLLAAVVERRYLVDKKLAQAAGDAFGVGTLFLWQPSPYDSIKMNEMELRTFRGFLKFRPVLKPLNARLRNRIDEPGFIFLADIFAGDHYIDTYLDECHYGDTATRKLAREIADRISKSNLLAKR
jgi:lysophospholipase L1-like esterase